MKDADYHAVKNYLKPLAEQWISLCGVGWDHVDLFWQDSYFDETVDGHPRDCMAYCDADWRYLHASITFSCAKIGEHFDFETGKPKDEDRIRELVVHEIMHVMLNEMREWRHHDKVSAIKHEERVATRLARAFCYTFDHGVKEGKHGNTPEDHSKARSRKA